MASLRKAAQCIGLSGRISLARDFFGFRLGVPKGHSLSLLRQIRLLQGKHFHLNAIRTAPFNRDLLARIDVALQEARDIYARANIGIGRIQHFRVPQGGFEIIMGWDVAPFLWESWSVPNDGIDAFFCYSLNGPESGRSPEPGSCDKDGKDSGLVVGVLDNVVLGRSTLGNALAHELGHFFDLEHEDEDDETLKQKLMWHSAPNGGNLDGGQIGAIQLHCSMRSGCQT